MVRSTTIKTDTAWCIKAAQASTRKYNTVVTTVHLLYSTMLTTAFLNI